MRRFRRSSSYRFSIPRLSSDELAALQPSIERELEIDLRHTLITEDFVFSWQHLSAIAEVKNKGRWLLSNRREKDVTKQVLDNVSGSVSSGEMLAVIGGPDSGKSVLLKVLSGELMPNVLTSGHQLISGKHISPHAKKFFSYFPMEDIFFGMLTVHEHLVYQLDLVSCMNCLIGNPGQFKGISPGRRKKLSIASKILLDTRVLLCDEPTTGLEPAEGFHVMTNLQKLAAGKRIVICALRQPTSEIYSLFQNVLVLSHGRVVFMGTTDEVLHFFKCMRQPCPRFCNPADHIMKVLSEISVLSDQNAINDMCDAYAESGFAEKFISSTHQVSERGFEGQPRMSELGFRRERTVELWFKLFGILLHRSHICMKREPLLTTIQIIYGFGAAIFIAVFFWGHVLNQARIFTLNSILFVMLLSITFQSIFTITYAVCKDIDIFVAEQGLDLFGASAFFIARSIAEFYAIFAFPLIFTTIIYWCVGFQALPIKYTVHIGVAFLASNVAVSFVHLMACIFKKASVAVPVASLLSSVLAIYGGYLLHAEAMPITFFWLKYLSWFWYSFEILMVNQWAGMENIACDLKNVTFCMNSGQEVLKAYNLSQDNLVLDISLLAGLYFAFRVLSLAIFLIHLKFGAWDVNRG